MPELRAGDSTGLRRACVAGGGLRVGVSEAGQAGRWGEVVVVVGGTRG